MQLTDLTWPRVHALPRETPIVIPVAALEQHGHHMPLFTDSLLLGEVIRRAAESLDSRILFAPLQWLGNSDHHMSLAGTLSAAPRLYLDLLSGLAQNFVAHGFRRIVFVNGHGGNDVPGRQVVFELRQKHRDRKDLLFLFGTYWSLGSPPPAPDPRFEQRQMGHACEWETSMMLRLSPQLVGDYRQAAPVPFGNPFEPAARGWIMGDRSAPGHIGSPHLATAEKGEWLFQRFTRDVADLLERVLKWDGRSWDG
ncbi:MAG: creatininase family protein [Verrucomicrobia bacterium]|nr:creatininase family protein [Verrucomicrobiota bacterium]MBI3868786.1 creatininase family protein [Verrucomicrobiota bacterium]